jgi:phosphoribosylformylglycinamidine cyclo-ligase
MAASFADNYKSAGVDTDEADTGLARLTKRITENWPRPEDPNGGVQLPIGFYANIVNVGGRGIAITTDGIGSKAVIADMLGKYDTVGIDCVAMNVNDLICVGAKPVSMVDYLAVEKADARMLDEISIGLAEGARRAGVTISGGETAQLKGIIHGFDLAGTAIGVVDLGRILVGQDIEDGDAVIGVASNGIHANGLTLARRAFFDLGKMKISHRFPELSQTLGEELLRPTHIYVREALALMNEVASLRALCHITGDGFLNLTRVKRDVSFVLNDLPETPPVFDLIARHGQVAHEEMFSVYNMGVGLCAIMGAADADDAVRIFADGGFKARVIGRVVADGKREVRLPRLNIVGRGKHFRRA